MSENITIRRLRANDLMEFFSLRLEALQNSPTSFLSSYAEEKAAGQAFFENILQDQGEENIIFGAFVANKLIGSIGIYRETKKNLRHKCAIWGMYVQPNYRNQKVGRALVEKVIEHAKNKMRCQVISLTVETGNTPAIKLYKSFGFESWGNEPNAKQVNGKSYNLFYMSLALAV